MKNSSWFILLTIFSVLGIIADLTGVFGIDVDQIITMRWLLIEVVVSAGIIVVMAQFMIKMRQQLDIPDKNSQDLIDKLSQENTELRSLIKDTIYERELLKSAIHVIEIDRETQLADPEIAHLSAIADGMIRGGDKLSEEDKINIIKSIIKVTCADRNFRHAEQVAVRSLAKKYNTDDTIVTSLINQALDNLKSVQSKIDNK